MNINPALTGIFKGDIRVSGNYRAQWTNVPVDYRSFSVGADHVFYLKGVENGRVAGGLLFNYDEAGDSELQYLNLAANGSYTLQMDERQFLTVGLQLGGVTRSLEQSGLQFDQQFNGEIFDPSLPNGEDFTDRNSGTKFDLGVGVNYRYQNPRERTTLDVGAGVFHLTEPDLSFFDMGFAPLERRFSLHGLLVKKLTDRLDLIANANWQMQGTSDEVVGSLGARYHLSTTHTREVALELLFGYRTFNNSDALFPMFVLHYRAFRFGLSYDATISDFTVANRGQGGPEISFSYIFTKVRPIPLKICPIF